MKLAVVALGTKQHPLPSATHKSCPRRRSAAYDDCIFKGAKPSDLPTQASVKFEFVINLKTGQALGLDVPPTLLKLADEVIE
jgi:ABC transporter substrate binding protein